MPKHEFGSFEGHSGLSVKVKQFTDNQGRTISDINGAVRNLKRLVTTEGLLRDLRRKEYYEPGTVKRRRKAAEAVKRWQKKLKLKQEEL